jgi:hypothetical protein
MRRIFLSLLFFLFMVPARAGIIDSNVYESTFGIYANFWTNRFTAPDSSFSSFGGIVETVPVPMLTSDLVLYVNPTNGVGSDSTNSGLSPQSPFQTIQHAIDVVPKNLGGFNAWIYPSEKIKYTNDSATLSIAGFYNGTFHLHAVFAVTNYGNLNVTDDSAVIDLSAWTWLLDDNNPGTFCIGLSHDSDVELTSSAFGATSAGDASGSVGVQCDSSVLSANGVSDATAFPVSVMFSTINGGLIQYGQATTAAPIADTNLVNTPLGLIFNNQFTGIPTANLGYITGASEGNGGIPLTSVQAVTNYSPSTWTPLAGNVFFRPSNDWIFAITPLGTNAVCKIAP